MMKVPKGWTDVSGMFSNIKSWANSNNPYHITTHLFIRKAFAGKNNFYQIAVESEIKASESNIVKGKNNALKEAFKYMRGHPNG